MSHTEKELLEIEARLKAATPGPWYWDSYSKVFHPMQEEQLEPDDPDVFEKFRDVCYLTDWTWPGPNERGEAGHGDELWAEEAKANADFIAHAPTDVARLLYIVRSLEQELEQAINALALAALEMGRVEQGK